MVREEFCTFKRPRQNPPGKESSRCKEKKEESLFIGNRAAAALSLQRRDCACSDQTG